MSANITTKEKTSKPILCISSFGRSRFLRETDRKTNGMSFPSLYYPELYLLEGGYNAFYAECPVSNKIP